SLEKDPFYVQTYFEQSEVSQSCAAELEGEARQAYLSEAVESLETGLARRPREARQWLRLAEINAQLGNAQEAAAAAEEAINRGGDDFSSWRVNFTVAQWFVEEEALADALQFAESALVDAPDEARPQIQQLIDRLQERLESGS
ncbi:MAG: hypothetical protein R3300_16430, partial [Candidatus Promineifilaceae bacterium]|nr:hypothetical protein [Candidatus Promineifilaceae bacterium]